MKIRILTLSLLLVLLASFALTGCDEHILDANGDNTSICTITKAQLEAEEPEYLEEGMVEAQNEGEYTVQFTLLSGVYDSAKYAADSETLTVNTEVTLTKGNLRVMLMHDGEFVQDIPVGTNTLVIKGAKGNYYLRIAGESAELNAKITFAQS